MSVLLLLDENIEHEAMHRLRKYGHDVEHINFHETLQPSDEDETLAHYSLENEALIVTYDDDFATAFTESAYWGVLLLSDDSWSATQVADVVHRILNLYDESSLSQLNLVGREWL
jgi:predicted nuclease of predicted toxin-antitoxin system